MKLDQPSSNLDHCKGGNGMYGWYSKQCKQQVTAQSLGSYSQEEKQTGSWYTLTAAATGHFKATPEYL